MSHLSRESRAAPSIQIRQGEILSAKEEGAQHHQVQRNASPIDPPADIEQYSKSPSNTGQSSPTLTVEVF